MSKGTILGFYKRESTPTPTPAPTPTLSPTLTPTTRNPDSHTRKVPRIEKDLDNCGIERDPGLRQMIWPYPPNKKDEIRRTYLGWDPLQATSTNSSKHVEGDKKFLLSWFALYSDWLDPTFNRAFCLPYFLFGNPSLNPTANAFVEKGFNNWNKVGGTNCSFKLHVGAKPNSKHRMAIQNCNDLLRSKNSIKICVEKVGDKSVAMNRLRVGVSADIAKLCAVQGIPFKGHDESASSSNRGNFLEILKHTTSYNEDVRAVVLENAPRNATYTSHQTQVEILSIFASKTQKFIRLFGSSAKRHVQLLIAEAIHIDEMIAADELLSESGQNQLKFLKRSGDTRWSSYLHSISSLFDLYDITLVVLHDIKNDPTNNSRSVADGNIY